MLSSGIGFKEKKGAIPVPSSISMKPLLLLSFTHSTEAVSTRQKQIVSLKQGGEWGSVGRN